MLGDNPDEIRPFPPAATPVQFPQFIPTTPQYTRDALRLERVHKRLTRLTNPSGLKAEDITDLNVHITQNVALDALIPNGSDGQRCLPSPQWDSTASKKTDQLPRQLYTGEQAPDRTLYLARKAELDFDSDEAYRAVHRQASKRDGKIAKVGNYFKFWAALEHVSRHWDTSRDTEEEIKGKVNRPRPSSHDEKSDAMDVDPPAQIESYTGQRVGSGIDMPPTFRENCVKSFIEIIAWLFRCQLQSVSFPLFPDTSLIKQKSKCPTSTSSWYMSLPCPPYTVCLQNTCRPSSRTLRPQRRSSSRCFLPFYDTISRSVLTRQWLSCGND